MKQQVSDEEILSAAMTLLSVEDSRAQAIAAVLLAAAQPPTTGSAPALFPSAGAPSTTPAIVATAASVSGTTDATLNSGEVEEWASDVTSISSDEETDDGIPVVVAPIIVAAPAAVPAVAQAAVAPAVAAVPAVAQAAQAAVAPAVAAIAPLGMSPAAAAVLAAATAVLGPPPPPIGPPSPLTAPWVVPPGFVFHRPSPGSAGPFYLISRGRNIGIFAGWHQAAPLVLRVGGAVYHGVPSVAEGESILNDAIARGDVAILP